MKIVVGENGRDPEKNLPRPRFVITNPHGMTETRTRVPSGGRRAFNRLRHEAAYIAYYIHILVHNFSKVGLTHKILCSHYKIKQNPW